MNKNMTQWVRNLIASPTKKAMPVLSFPAISALGCTVDELVRDRELQVRAMAYVAEKTDTLAVLSMMDLSVEADAFGAKICYASDELPTVVGQMITDPDEAEELEIPEVMEHRTAEYIEAVRSSAAKTTDRPVFAGCIGPFTLAARLQDVTEALMNCYDEPEMVHAILEKTSAFLVNYLNAFKEAGADGVVLAEPLTGILSPALAEEFSHPYVKQVIDAVQDDSFLVIYHNCGDKVPMMIDEISRLGAKAYHLGNAVVLKDMIPAFSPDVLVMGNIDPVGHFLNGSPASITAAVHQLMEDCAGYPNFVPSSGCDIPPATPWTNIEAFFCAVKSYYENR